MHSRHSVPHSHDTKRTFDWAIFILGFLGNAAEKCTTGLSIRKTERQSRERSKPNHASSNDGLAVVSFGDGQTALYSRMSGSAEGLSILRPLASGGWKVLLDLGKAVSFAMSILSLCALLDTAFFLPATRWEERLLASVARIGLAGCVCLISGLLFHFSEPQVPLARTLPVRVFVWGLFGFSLLFVLGWYLDAYYVPLLWRNLPH
jgi:hypothetical protein